MSGTIALVLSYVGVFAPLFAVLVWQLARWTD